METIIEAKEANYISQIEELKGDLPDNCRLNKILTGCGGTTVALSNDKNYIIAVPFIEMIKNKVKSHPNVQPVYGDISDAELENYKGNKWMCTYDSLLRVMNLIDPKEYKLLVDESHKLVDSGSFRGKSIRIVLNNFKSFNSYVFMTATPVPDDLQYPVLVEVPKVTIKWSNIEPVEVKFTQLESSKKNIVNMSVAKISVEHCLNLREGNAHIFINSVKSICDVMDVLKKKEIPMNLVNIVVANNSRNRALLTTCGCHEIGSVSTPSKVNFYTATAFEGSDIFDSEGVVYVASDGFKDHTKINILSTLPQIIGRIRDIKMQNRNKVNLIFSPNAYYNFSSEKEFREYTLSQLDLAGKKIEEFQSILYNKEEILKGYFTNTYIVEDETGNPEVNVQVIQSELYHYRTIHSTYYVKGGVERRNSVVVSNGTTFNYVKGTEVKEFSALDNFLIGKKPNYAAMAEKYSELRVESDENLESYFYERNPILDQIEAAYPEIKEIFDTIGAAKMKALKFRKGQMTDYLIYINDEDTIKEKVGKLLSFKDGEFLPAKELKGKLVEIYKTLGISRSAKSTDIEEFYVIRKSTKRDKNTKKTINGIIIVRKKLVKIK